MHEGIPDVVVFAFTTEQVSAIMRLANEKKIPVTVQGSGTATTGASLPVKGGILLDLHRMNNILEIDKDNFYARVEPGVICMQLNAELGKQNLMFPPNPGSEAIATIGGMMSTNASGHRAVKYGTARDYVKDLKVVLVDGTVIETGFKTPKSSFGYDLNRVFASAEGTLGVITEVTVKIQVLPEYNALALAIFEDLFAAGAAVTDIIGSGIQLTACEILDKYSLKVVEKAIERDITGIEAMLIIESDGAKETVVKDMERINEICKKHAVKEFTWSDDPARAGKSWRPGETGADALPNQTGKPAGGHFRRSGHSPHQNSRGDQAGPGDIPEIWLAHHHFRTHRRWKRAYHHGHRYAEQG